MKHFLTELRIKVLTILGALIVTALGRSLRWKTIGFLFKTDTVDPDQLRLIVLWHNRQLMAPYIYSNLLPAARRSDIYCLTSQHSDGRLIAGILHRCGLKTVAGSSSRGGKRALIQLLRILRQGNSVAITPDGPKGPIYKLKPGILKLAQATSLPIYTLAYSAKHHWTFKSWDKMILPKPWSPAVVTFEGPYFIPAQASKEDLASYAEKLEAQLNRITELMDNYEYA